MSAAGFEDDHWQRHRRGSSSVTIRTSKYQPDEEELQPYKITGLGNGGLA